MSAVETYRGIKIERTADVVGFVVRPRDAFCFSVRERPDDSAPIIDTFPSVEEAREGIDEYLEEMAQ